MSADSSPSSERFTVEEIERKAVGTRKAATLYALWDRERHAYVDSSRVREKMETKAVVLNASGPYA